VFTVVKATEICDVIHDDVLLLAYKQIL